MTTTATLPRRLPRPAGTPDLVDLASVLVADPDLRGAACAASAPMWEGWADGRETARERAQPPVSRPGG